MEVLGFQHQQSSEKGLVRSNTQTGGAGPKLHVALVWQLVAHCAEDLGRTMPCFGRSRPLTARICTCLSVISLPQALVRKRQHTLTSSSALISDSSRVIPRISSSFRRLSGSTCPAFAGEPCDERFLNIACFSGPPGDLLPPLLMWSGDFGTRMKDDAMCALSGGGSYPTGKDGLSVDRSL